MSHDEASTQPDHRSAHGRVTERRPAMIYFLVDAVPGDTRLKIGWSSSPEGVVGRFRQHTSSNTRLRFYCAVEGSRTDEQQIHDHFRPERIRNGSTSDETYAVSDRLGDYVEWLGEQPWAACSLEEVIDPFGHWPQESKWLPWQNYRNGTSADAANLLWSMVPYFGSLRGPLPAEERGSSFVRDSNEWYTPARFTDAARMVMGTIDLDPASSHFANRTIRADRIFTKSQDGLAPSNVWCGNVWMNPPYGSEQVDFVRRVVREHESGAVPQAVVCLNGYRYDAQWFRPLWRYPICWSAQRVGFIGGMSKRTGPKTDETADQAPSNGTVFIYLGPNVAEFAEVFSEFGFVTLPAVQWKGTS